MKNAILVFFSSLTVRFGAFFASAVASMTVDLVALAEITTLLLGYQTASSIATGGIAPLIIKKVALSKRRPEILRSYIKSLFFVGSALAVVFACLFFFIGAFFLQGASLFPLFLFSAAALLNAQFHKFQAAHQGFQNFGEYTLGNVVFSIALLISLCFLWVFPGVAVCGAAYLVSNLAAVIYSRWRLRLQSAKEIPVHGIKNMRNYNKGIWKRSVKLFGANLLVLPTIFFVSILLNYSAPPLQSSIFNILMQWRSLIGLAPGAVAQAYLPKLSERNNNGPAMWRKFCEIYLFTMLVSAIGFYLTRSYIFFVYPQGLNEDTFAINALILASMLSQINALAGQFLFINGRYNGNIFSNFIWSASVILQVSYNTPELAGAAILCIALSSILQFAFISIYIIPMLSKVKSL